jgi:hypothetical protein
MLFLFIISIIIIYIMLYLFFNYLKWANSYYEFHDQKNLEISLGVYKETTDVDYSFLLPTRAVKDSYKLINFWIQYYYTKTNLYLKRII